MESILSLNPADKLNRSIACQLQMAFSSLHSYFFFLSETEISKLMNIQVVMLTER